MKKLFNVSTDEELLRFLETEGAYMLMLIIFLVVFGSPFIFIQGFKGIFFMTIKLLFKLFVITFSMAVFVGCRIKFKSRKIDILPHLGFA